MLLPYAAAIQIFADLLPKPQLLLVFGLISFFCIATMGGQQADVRSALSQRIQTVEARHSSALVCNTRTCAHASICALRTHACTCARVRAHAHAHAHARTCARARTIAEPHYRRCGPLSWSTEGAVFESAALAHQVPPSSTWRLKDTHLLVRDWAYANFLSIVPLPSLWTVCSSLADS